jgi:hypothetical protein
MGKEIRVEEVEDTKFVVRLVSPELPEFEEELKDVRESAKALTELITEVARKFESVTISIFPTLEGVKSCHNSRGVAHFFSFLSLFLCRTYYI